MTGILPASALIEAGYPDDIGDDATGCESCDGYGVIWNNADPTSGQWCPCDDCGDTRGHP